MFVKIFIQQIQDGVKGKRGFKLHFSRFEWEINIKIIKCQWDVVPHGVPAPSAGRLSKRLSTPSTYGALISLVNNHRICPGIFLIKITVLRLFFFCVDISRNVRREYYWKMLITHIRFDDCRLSSIYLLNTKTGLL